MRAIPYCKAATAGRVRRIAAAAFAAAALFASGPLPAPAAPSPSPVSLRASATPTDPHPGEVVQIRVAAQIGPGWHLYSLVPTPPPGPSATTVAAGPVSGELSASGTASESRPTFAFDKNFGKPVSFHTGHAVFTVPVRLSRTARLRPFSVPVAVHYQVCNDSICLPPTTRSLSVRLTPTAGPVRAQYSRMPQAARETRPSPAAEPAAPRAALPGFLAAAFAAGLLALLTPCVFPLIPVTFGFFTKQAGDRPHRLIVLAGVYAIGIVISFTVLGLAAALVFGAAGANRVAANPWFNLFFGVLFVVFAFSFFESFLLRLPAGLSRLARPAAHVGGAAGVLLMGLAFVFAAFTCTAPFIGTVLVAAASASSGAAWVRPLLGMCAFALALALPFFALALFPGLLARLPKSGGWMTRFKGALGFIELAYALTYFSKADLVWQAHLLTGPVILALWALIAIAAALYLLGLLRVSAFPEPPSRISPARWVWAAVFAGAGVYCLYGLSGRPISGLLLAYLPPAGYGVSASGPVGQCAADMAWLSQYPEALAQARRSGKPLFIDFTGYTCTNCRYVEQNIFTKPAVGSLLAGDFVRLRLYTDGGADAAANQALQQRMFGTVALPLYAIVASGGRVVAQLSGSGDSPAQFAAFLRTGLTGSAAQPSTPASASAAAALWQPYSAQAAAAALAAHRPAIIDFTASWCTNCHALERTVFTAPPVENSLPRFTTLRADLTNFSSPASVALEKQYGIVSLPAVVFLSPVTGKEVPGTRISGLVAPSVFAAHMARASRA